MGAGAYAWLLPDGSWGFSNAGLVVDGDESLLVDTLFDLALTDEMLRAMRRAEPAATRRIGTLVNTHANGDHTHGNQLVPAVEIISSRATRDEMEALPPAALERMKQAFANDESPLARYMRRAFGPFDFAGIEAVLPTLVFDGTLRREVGDKTVELIEVGPAHTRGDVLVHVPGDRVVFTGDILFVEGTPIIWEGPVSNWITACERIEAMDVDVVVPGHGPITDKRGAAAVKAYLVHVRDAARQRFDAGMSVEEATRDIPLGAFSDWSDSERIAVNVDALYKEFAGAERGSDVLTLFTRMAELAKARA